MGMWKKHIGVLTPLILLGSHILNYDSMIVLTHFKGHAMGGFGGSLKNIAIGNAPASWASARSTVIWKDRCRLRGTPGE